MGKETKYMQKKNTANQQILDQNKKYKPQVKREVRGGEEEWDLEKM